MGSWDTSIFGNDTACDWSYGLESATDLGHIESTISELEQCASDYIDSDVACNTLAACEVLTRLLGNGGESNAYTEATDRWVKAHPLKPSPELIGRAKAAAKATLQENSELAELWGGDDEWIQSVDDVVARLG